MATIAVPRSGNPFTAFSERTFAFWVTACLLAGFLAVGLGGVVRITGSGLGCPDWPTCYGSIIPPANLEAWIESIHRWGAVLMGVFGLGALVTAFGAPGVSGPQRVMVVIAAIMYPMQAVLGAITVLWEIPPVVAAAHFATATALLGLLAVVVAGAVRPFRNLTASLKSVTIPTGYVYILVGFAVLAFMTVVAGTILTRSGAAGVCTGFPLCDTAAPTSTVARLQEIHMLHRFLGYFAAIYAVGMLWMTWLLSARALRPWIGLVGAVVAIQVGLGITNVVAGLPQWSRAGHVLFAVATFAVIMLVLGAVWRARSASGSDSRMTGLVR